MAEFAKAGDFCRIPIVRIMNRHRRVAAILSNSVIPVQAVSAISARPPLGMACPHYELIRKAVVKKSGPEILILDYTH